MHRKAATKHLVHELIHSRWSPRAYSDKAIAPEILQSLFEAARWAPSSSNEQPWAFLVGVKGEGDTFQRILGTLVEANHAWAKHAPVLVIAVSELAFARNAQPNRNAFYDTGAAVSQLTAEATSRGVFVHQMAGFDPRKAVEAFAIPNGWEPISVFALGYMGDPEALPEKLRERELAPAKRKPLHEFVMSGNWGNAAPFARE